MFKSKQQFEVMDHPQVIAALGAVWDEAYAAGLRDALATVRELRAELARARQAARLDPETNRDVLDAVDSVIYELEQADDR